jgi:DNA replication protein DnaC
VRLLRADALLRLLKQSRMDNSREAVMTQLATVDVLLIDDFALEPMTREESGDIYQLFVERNARFSTVVTTSSSTASPTDRGSSPTSTSCPLRLRLR